MSRMILAVCVLLQLMNSVTAAGEIPVRGNSERYNETLAGMPFPDSVPVFGSLKGVIQTSDGMPLAGGEINFFSDAAGPIPSPEKYWRVPDKTSALDEKGGFSVELPPGGYYIGAIQRHGDQAMIGPPSDGDIYYAGQIKYEVISAAQNDLGVIKGAKPFSMKISVNGAVVTAIEGSVLDVFGKSVVNVMIFAHRIAEMTDRPLFVSARTDKNGAYRLRVAGSGTFYLRVSDFYGVGIPSGGGGGKKVVVKEGAVIKGINLTELESVQSRRKTTN